MSTFNYSGMASTASSLISRFGQDHTFTRYTDVFDPDSGANVRTSTNYTAKAVKSNFTKMEMNDQTIQKDDIKLICDVNTYAVGDSVSINSQTYTVLDVNPIEPGSLALAYILQVRK